MKKIKTPFGINFTVCRTLSVIFVLLGISAAGFALEAGVSTNTKVGLKKSVSSVFSAGERLDGWWKIPFGVSGSVFEGSAHFDETLYADDDPSLSSGRKVSAVPSGDIDRARIAFVFPKIAPAISVMNVEFGRLKFSDDSGLIVSHPLDGALLGIDLSMFNFNAQAGYTSLILRNANGINVSLYDQTAKSDSSRVFGNSRLLVKTGIGFPDVYGQTIKVSFLAQQDLSPNSALIPEWTQAEYIGTESRGGRVNTQYSSLTVSGPIARGFFYDGWITYGSGKTLTWAKDDESPSGYSYQYAPISSVLAGASLDFYVPSMLSSAFNFRFLYASGDSDYSRAIEGNTSGSGTQFIPLTASSLGLVFSPSLSNLIETEIGGSVKPVSSLALQTGMKLLAFFRPTEGPVNVSGIKPGSTSPWLGFEADLFGMYRIMSDLGLSLNAGLFLPGVSPNGAFSTGTSPLWYSLDLALVLDL